MAQLSRDTPRDLGLGDIEEYPVTASSIIYEGAFVGENGSGYARQLTAADPFIGVAIEVVDNLTGAAGAQRVKVRTKGVLRNMVLAAAAITVNDRPLVYASDSDTLTLTAESNTPIGTVRKFVGSGIVDIEFDASP